MLVSSGSNDSGFYSCWRKHCERLLEKHGLIIYLSCLCGYKLAAVSAPLWDYLDAFQSLPHGRLRAQSIPRKFCSK